MNLPSILNALKSFSIIPEKETIELHLKLNINPKLQEHQFLDSFIMPYKSKKNVKILVASTDTTLLKISPNIDYILSDDVISKLKEGKIFFDYCVASPETIRLLAPYSKLLGPKGLMPNIKLGTLNKDILSAVTQIKSGQIILKNDKFGILHIPISLVNLNNQLIVENLNRLLDYIKSKKPSSIKGLYIKSAYLSTSFGPSFNISIKE